jgi:hypothetical protein
VLITQLQSFCGFFIAAYRKLLQHGNTRYLYYILRNQVCECILLFYHAELTIEKTSTAFIEMAWELWKLAKFAREKGQYFFDPRNLYNVPGGKKYH